MDIFIDYETVCVNCKARGYSFGYSFKTIMYKGQTALDCPQRHLNGPMITFDYQEKPVLLHCLENAHLMGTEQRSPAFSMINAKKGTNVSKFTYQFSPLLHPLFKNQEQTAGGFIPKLMLYVDMYLYEDKPYCFIFYTFRNRTLEPINKFSFFQFFDFDIYGQDGYKNDCVESDPETGVIYQYNNAKGKKLSLFAGLGTIKTLPPAHIEGNTPEEIIITEEKRRESLRDNLSAKKTFGPSDCAVAYQWNLSMLYPDNVQVFPVMLVFGFGEKQFLTNCAEAQERLNSLMPVIYNSVNDKFRQIIDPELEKLGFSMRQWCKE